MATATTKTTTNAAQKTTDAAKKATASAADAGVDFMKTTEDFADNARAQYEDMMRQFTDNAETIREQSEEFAAELRARIEKHQQLAADVNAEIVEAAKTEISDAVQFANDLGRAKTLSDALEIQQDYWTKLFQNRLARTQDLTAKSVDAAKEAFTPFNADFGGMFDTSAMEKMFRFPAKA